MSTQTRMLRVTLALAAGIASLAMADDGRVLSSGAMLSHAEARIGRPLTPMSYAGVARRTTRRAVYGTAAVGAAAAAGAYAYGSYYAAPGCMQVVNAYGQIVYQCP
jgi:hypothetical protein